MKFFAMLIGVGAFMPSLVLARPTFIRFGYPTCTSCHYSPQGGGLLNDYGRGVAAGQSIFRNDDYKPPSGSLAKILTWNGKLRHGLEARGLMVYQYSDATFIPMQLDYLNSFQPTEQVRLDTTFGFVPEEALSGISNHGLKDHFVFRKLLLSLDPKDGVEISVGRDALPLGINSENHTLYARRQNRREVTDFVTQMRLDLSTDHLLFTPFVYLPGYQESRSNQETGAGARFEYYFTDYVTLGTHFLAGSSNAIDRLMGGIFTRVGRGPFGLLAEYDLTNRSLNSTDLDFNQHAFYGQFFYTPIEWAEISVVGEFLKVQEPFTDDRFRVGPSFNLRLTHYLSLIGTAQYEERSLGNVWTYYAQIFGNF